MIREIKSLFQFYGKEAAIEMCLKATAELREAMKEEKDNTVLSPKAQKLREKCISFGPTGPMFASLISDIIDEDIRIVDTNKKFPFIRFACIVPTATYESHNYPLDEVFSCIFYTGDINTPETIKGLRRDGSFGNSFYPIKRICSIPKDSQIISFVENVFEVSGGDPISW